MDPDLLSKCKLWRHFQRHRDVVKEWPTSTVCRIGAVVVLVTSGKEGLSGRMKDLELEDLLNEKVL